MRGLLARLLRVVAAAGAEALELLDRLLRKLLRGPRDTAKPVLQRLGRINGIEFLEERKFFTESLPCFFH